MSLFAELKRRNVFRVGAAYVVVGWLLLQAADILLGNFGAPEWVFKSLVALLLLGCPLALFLSGAYELTAEGVRRSADVSAETTGSRAGTPIDWPILAGIAMVIAVMVAERVWAPATPERVVVPGEVSEAAPRSAQAPPAPRETAEGVFIAVLLFDNYSPDPADAYFAGNMIRITTQLADAASGRHLWSTDFDRMTILATRRS